MITRWLPWKMLVRRAAKAHGFLDPVDLMARLHSFAQPSEVAEPIELLRAGVIFHARGLINTKAIQHNLDWVWPYWVERQFNPQDPSFIPRAFSITHINMTQRNWTAVGLPDCSAYPIVDPRGLLTPFFDGWSIDAWIMGEDGTWLLPSKQAKADQELLLGDSLSVRTQVELDRFSLESNAQVISLEGVPTCRSHYTAKAESPAWLVLTLRPYNPEGVSFVHELAAEPDTASWLVNDNAKIVFDTPWDSLQASKYNQGDVRLYMPKDSEDLEFEDKVGMLTAAAMYELKPGTERAVSLDIDLSNDKEIDDLYPSGGPPVSWPDAVKGLTEMKIPDEQFQFLYDAAIRNLILHSPGDSYPGPYTYRRFWFRDAAFLTNAMMSVGMFKRVQRQLDAFLPRQTSAGYFKSQDGEWDSNGEAMWAMDRFLKLTNKSAPDDWQAAMKKGADWIIQKRLFDGDAWHNGLLPAGFSAEHLGTNDYYYWDDFWSVAGLRAAAQTKRDVGEVEAAQVYDAEADDLLRFIEASLEVSDDRRDRGGIPASPYRRMDAGAIGSIACGYPLQLVKPDDKRLLTTVDFLLSRCMCNGGFFQDMIHSGINAYLTLHLAQVLLRAGDPRYMELIQSVSDLASPTGQWPEAIHPQTGGGCMGDGQHIWAAAEWVLMMRALFVREEEDSLLFCSGIPSEWLEPGSELMFGPTPTQFGVVALSVSCTKTLVKLEWHGSWHDLPPKLALKLPWMSEAESIDPDTSLVKVKRT